MALGINKTLDFVLFWICICSTIGLLEYFVQNSHAMKRICRQFKMYFNNWVGIKNYNYEK